MYEPSYYDNSFDFVSNFWVIMQTYIFAMGIIIILLLVCMWKIFTKAGQKGWYSLIPVYNIMVLLQISGLKAWYIILFLIPFINIYVIFKLYINLAHQFGKSTGFGIACVFFSIICLPILAFGKDEYQNEQVAEYSHNQIYHKELERQQITQNESQKQEMFSTLETQENTTKSTKYCPNCGNQVSDSAMACFMCGHNF